MANYQPQGEQRGRSRFLVGCCLGCAGLVVVGGATVGLLIYFMVRSRPVLPPETFLTADADAFLILQVSPGDEGLLQVLQQHSASVAEAAGGAQARPPVLPQDAQAMAASLEQFLPFHLVLTARHTEEEGEFLLGGAASIKPMSGFWRFLLNRMISSGGAGEDYKGVAIGTGGPRPDNAEGPYIAAVDNNFMLAQDKETVKRWIDRIEEQKKLMKEAEPDEQPVLPYEGPGPLKEMYGRLDKGAAVRLATLNEHGEILHLLRFLAEQQTDEESAEMLDLSEQTGIADAQVEVAGGSAQFLDADTLSCRLLFECASDQFATELSERLSAFGAEVAPELEAESLEGTAEGTLVEVELTLTGVQDFLRQAGNAPRGPAQWPPANTIPQDAEPVEEPSI